MYKYQLAVILATIGVFLISTSNGCEQVNNCNWPDECLRNQVFELRIKLAESRYKDDLIQSLKETIEAQKVFCISTQSESTNDLKQQLAQAQQALDFYKKNEGKLKKLKMCEAKVNSLKEELKAANINPKNEAPAIIEPIANSCNSFAYTTGIQIINLPGTRPFNALCDGETVGPGWMVIQQRIDGTLDFYRNWAEYRNGFGNLDGEFWIGLENLFRITNYKRHELYVHLEYFNGKVNYANYDNFAIGNEREKYVLKSVGQMTGNAGDRLKKSVNLQFSTYDNDNDDWQDGSCAAEYHGAWWYKKQTDRTSNLNGRYYESEEEHKDAIHWYHFIGLKSVKMLIRPKKGCE